MAKYKALTKTWLSHENRTVDEGETFETVFPKGTKLSDNIILVKENKTG